jgi:hypothetical protein
MMSGSATQDNAEERWLFTAGICPAPATLRATELQPAFTF